MAVKPTSKKAKAKSKPESTSSSEESVIIDGTAEDVTDKTKTAASAEDKPKADAKKESSPPPSKSPSKKSPLSQFAMLMAVVALGLAGWAVFIGQKNIDPAWRGDLASRLSNVEAAIQDPPSFDDRHLARQENLAALEAQVTSLHDAMTRLSADLETRIAAAVPSSAGQSSPATDTQVLTDLKQEMEQLRQEIALLQAEIATIKTDISTKISTAEPPAPENTNPDQAAPEDSGSWWQSLFGSIRISRLPDDANEAK